MEGSLPLPLARCRPSSSSWGHTQAPQLLLPLLGSFDIDPCHAPVDHRTSKASCSHCDLGFAPLPFLFVLLSILFLASRSFKAWPKCPIAHGPYGPMALWPYGPMAQRPKGPKAQRPWVSSLFGRRKTGKLQAERVRALNALASALEETKTSGRTCPIAHRDM